VQRKIRHENLSRELCSKSFNYLIHGIPESADNLWDTREQTEKLFRKILTEGLQIEDTNSITIADIHRLSQHPVYDKSHRKINRPIIIKFMVVFDKQNFIINLKHLRKYYENRHPKIPEYMFANEHLPYELQIPKKFDLSLQ